MEDDKLKKTLSDLQKRFGDDAVMMLGSTSYPPVEVVSTGSLSLDLALGVGGLPRGRITEIFGMDGSGKTTLCQHLVAEAQKLGHTCAYIDMEHALDMAYAANCGISLEKLMVSQPESGEAALQMAEYMIRSGVEVIIIDSVAALIPIKELEGQIGDHVVGMQARMMSQALRKMSGAIKTNNTLVIFTNQIRHKIGVMFGSPETTPGGLALKFYASVRLDIRRAEQIKSGTEIIGVHTKVRVIKNKVAPPFRNADFDIIYGKGISRTGELLDLGVKMELIEKSGSHFKFQETRLGQGREKARKKLEDDVALATILEHSIRERAQSVQMINYGIDEEIDEEPPF